GSQWMGAIRLAQPISTTLVAIVAMLIATILVAYISLGSITKKARVTGITVPVGGQLSVVAPNAGILLSANVQEEQHVKLGQVLFTIGTERQNSHGEITALVAQQLASRAESLAAEQRLRQSQYEEKKQALRQRLANLELEYSQLGQELLLAQRRQQLAQQSVAKYETLQSNGYVSAAQTQQKQEDLIDISTRLNTLQRNKTQLQANKIALQDELNTLALTLATDLSQIDRAIASVKQEVAENANRQSSQIVAAQAGTVTALTNQNGQAISAGQVLASLIPDSADGKSKTTTHNLLEANLYAASRTAGFITPGQQVLIRYAAFPYQKFGLHKATVIDVSRTPFAPAELPPHLASTILSNAQQAINGFNSSEALYRIRVKLSEQSIEAYGQKQAIKPGMTLEADVLQDSRKIWEWVLEPVLAMAQHA
ncbi:MAG: HlyD family efflux transporter periplasmic adaptor subunit, partial [Burkholderiales bacterium]|nr:HlyD family efflux transporter periplasmic adaptor subunit [Burkholderiales bacterium]